MDLLSLVNAFDWNEVKDITVLDQDNNTLQTVTETTPLKDYLKNQKVGVVHIEHINPRVISLTAQIAY